MGIFSNKDNKKGYCVFCGKELSDGKCTACGREAKEVVSLSSAFPDCDTRLLPSALLSRSIHAATTSAIRRVYFSQWRYGQRFFFTAARSST